MTTKPTSSFFIVLFAALLLPLGAVGLATAAPSAVQPMTASPHRNGDRQPLRGSVEHRRGTDRSRSRPTSRATRHPSSPPCIARPRREAGQPSTPMRPTATATPTSSTTRSTATRRSMPSSLTATAPRSTPSPRNKPHPPDRRPAISTRIRPASPRARPSRSRPTSRATRHQSSLSCIARPRREAGLPSAPTRPTGTATPTSATTRSPTARRSTRSSRTPTAPRSTPSPRCRAAPCSTRSADRTWLDGQGHGQVLAGQPRRAHPAAVKTIKDGTWKTIETGTQRANGYTNFHITDPLEVEHQYRAVANGIATNIVTFAGPLLDKNKDVPTVHFASDDGESVNTRDNWFDGEFTHQGRHGRPEQDFSFENCPSVSPFEAEMKRPRQLLVVVRQEGLQPEARRQKRTCAAWGTARSGRWWPTTTTARCCATPRPTSSASRWTSWSSHPRTCRSTSTSTGRSAARTSSSERVNLEGGRLDEEELKADDDTAPVLLDLNHPDLNGSYLMEWDFRKGAYYNSRRQPRLGRAQGARGRGLLREHGRAGSTATSTTPTGTSTTAARAQRLDCRASTSIRPSTTTSRWSS